VVALKVAGVAEVGVAGVGTVVVGSVVVGSVVGTAGEVTVVVLSGELMVVVWVAAVVGAREVGETAGEGSEGSMAVARWEED